jgi:hypothetical protein
LLENVIFKQKSYDQNQLLSMKNRPILPFFTMADNF